MGFLPMGVNFLLTPLYTYFMAPEEYGILGVADILSGFLAIIISLGVKHAFSRFYFDHTGDKEVLSKLLSTSYFFTLITGIVLLFALFPFAESILDWAFSNQHFSYTKYGVDIVIINLNIILSEIVLSYFRNQEAPRKYATNAMAFFLLNVTGILIGVIILELGAAGNIWGRAAGGTLFSLVVCISILRKHGFHFVKNMLRRMLSYGLPLIPYSLLLIIFNKADRIYVENQHGIEDLGVYNLARQATDVISVLFYSIFNTISPKLYKYYSGKSGLTASYMTKLNNYFFLAAVWVVSLAVLLNYPFFRWVTEEKYFAASSYAFLLCLMYLGHFFYMLFTVPILHSKKTRLMSVIIGLSLVVLVASLYYFNSIFGIIGIVLGLSLVKLVQATIAGSFSGLLLKLHLPFSIDRAVGLVLFVALATLAIEVLEFERWFANALISLSIAIASLIFFSKEYVAVLKIAANYLKARIA